MKNIINNLVGAMQSCIDYVENNADYTINYDILLADDSVYHSESWNDALILVSGEESEDWLEYATQTIVENLNYYCDIQAHIQGFPHPASSETIASFCIGEVEEQFSYSDFNIDANSNMLHLYIQYLNDKTDWYWVNNKHSKCLYAYADYSYSYVGYELKEEEIKELLATWLEEQESEED